MADLNIFVLGRGGSTSQIQPPFDTLSRAVTSEVVHIADTLTAPSLGGFVLRTASNTGLVGAGISEGSLTNQGAITYTSANNGQTITGKRFTGQVTVTSAVNLTFSGCLFEYAGGGGQMLWPEGAGNTITIEDCTFRAPVVSPTVGHEFCIRGAYDNMTVRRCDISGAENCILTTGDNVVIEDNFLHRPSSSDGSAHNDTIEVYAGDNVIIRRNTVILDFGLVGPTNPINVAPWAGSDNVSNLTIEENYVDGDYWTAILLDTQQAGTHTITNVRIIKNRFGGHNGGGDYGVVMGGPIQNTGGAMTRVSTDTAGTDQYYYPNSGSNANYWWYCTSNPFGFPDLSPDREGTIATQS